MNIKKYLIILFASFNAFASAFDNLDKLANEIDTLRRSKEDVHGEKRQKFNDDVTGLLDGRKSQLTDVQATAEQRKAAVEHIMRLSIADHDQGIFNLKRFRTIHEDTPLREKGHLLFIHHAYAYTYFQAELLMKDPCIGPIESDAYENFLIKKIRDNKALYRENIALYATHMGSYDLAKSLRRVSVYRHMKDNDEHYYEDVRYTFGIMNAHKVLFKPRDPSDQTLAKLGLKTLTTHGEYPALYASPEILPRDNATQSEDSPFGENFFNNHGAIIFNGTINGSKPSKHYSDEQIEQIKSANRLIQTLFEKKNSPTLEDVRNILSQDLQGIALDAPDALEKLQGRLGVYRAFRHMKKNGERNPLGEPVSYELCLQMLDKLRETHEGGKASFDTMSQWSDLISTLFYELAQIKGHFISGYYEKHQNDSVFTFDKDVSFSISHHKMSALVYDHISLLIRSILCNANNWQAKCRLIEALFYLPENEFFPQGLKKMFHGFDSSKQDTKIFQNLIEQYQKEQRPGFIVNGRKETVLRRSASLFGFTADG